MPDSWTTPPTAMRPPPSPYTDADDDWTYSETIDEATSAIRVRGLVDRLGVDLLRGTIEELSRRGHRDITVTMEHRDDVNACARGVLAEVAARLAADQGRLTIRWTADQTGSPRPRSATRATPLWTGRVEFPWGGERIPPRAGLTRSVHVTPPEDTAATR